MQIYSHYQNDERDLHVEDAPNIKSRPVTAVSNSGRKTAFDGDDHPDSATSKGNMTYMFKPPYSRRISHKNHHKNHKIIEHFF